MNKLIVISAILVFSITATQAATINSIADEISTESLRGYSLPISKYKAELLCEKGSSKAYKFLKGRVASRAAEGGAIMTFMLCMKKAGHMSF